MSVMSINWYVTLLVTRPYNQFHRSSLSRFKKKTSLLTLTKCDTQQIFLLKVTLTTANNYLLGWVDYAFLYSIKINKNKSINHLQNLSHLHPNPFIVTLRKLNSEYFSEKAEFFFWIVSFGYSSWSQLRF